MMKRIPGRLLEEEGDPSFSAEYQSSDRSIQLLYEMDTDTGAYLRR
jgi:hypothetical protein